MIDIKLEGLEQFQNIIKSFENLNFDNLRVVIYNDHEAAAALEYGSEPRNYPWKSAGDRTVIASDIFSHETKIVSIRGYGMLRGNQAKIQEYLEKELSKINLLNDIKKQIVNILSDCAEYWVDEAKRDSVGDLIDSNWDIKVYV